ncbi:adenosylcobinamide-GDP ribazoletransferase [Nocardia lijiangensis]|uniref:adenosylcobinamide-GDP ribazoletransferase n=1 Tax=Nocardia lijiangensis TaxID=299618 RepID=UPI0008374EF9|nr:adenosylcobinamide-GDP ribazoletransferase [Nocardia lijiangensis]
MTRAAGIRLAVSWLTVLPVRGPEEVDRAAASRAIALAPVVGVLLGAGAAALLWALTGAGASAPLAGLVTVAALALLTRGMHLDGLSDAMDGLGSYGPPERARQIMKSGGVGPFGAAALIFAIGVQSFAFAALADAGRWFAVALAVATGRVVVVLACRRGVPAAPGTAFGALVSDTQSPLIGAGWVVVALGCAVLAVPEHPWLGPVAVAVSVGIATLAIRHMVRRFGGLSGDVLGAGIEISVTVAAAGLSLAG